MSSNLAIPIKRKRTPPRGPFRFLSGITSEMRTHEVSSTTAERNEVKRDAGGLDRASHGKPGGQNVNEVNVLAISL